MSLRIRVASRRLTAVALVTIGCLTSAPLRAQEATVVTPVGEPSQAGDGRTVAAVEIRTDAARERDVERLHELIAIRAGEPFDPDAVRLALRNLSAAGVAGEIEAYRRETPRGIELTFALWMRLRVEEIVLEGELELPRRELRRVVAQGAGEPLVESRVVRSVYALQEFYRSRGWLGATVRVAVDTDPDAKRATVRFQVEPGPRTQVEAIRFQGDWDPLGREDLLQGLGMRVGERYLPSRVRDEAEGLRRHLIESGYRAAETAFVGAEVSRDATQATLTYRVDLGPRVEIEIVGAERKRLAKHELLPFMGRQGYDEALVLQAVDRIRSHYQEQGHFDVEVERQTEEGPGRLLLRLTISPGPVYRLASVGFAGNEFFSARRLRELVATSEERALVPGSGRLVQGVLEEDLRNLRTFYRLQGFAEADVGPPQIEYRPDRVLEVMIPIVEGRRQRVAELELIGNRVLSSEELLGRAPLTVGGPFHPRHLQETIDRIRSRYEEAGYRTARVSAEVEWNAPHTLAAVTLHLYEGPRITVNRVIVRGAQRTQPEVILRAIDLAPGDPISTRELLEVQRGLYRLGVFSSVEVRPAPGTPFSPQRDVFVRVREGQNRRVSYGVGYDTESGIRGLLGLGHSNLFGRAIGVRGDARVSEIDEELRLLVRQPYIGGLPWPVSAGVFKVTERHEGFISERRGAQARIERPGRNSTLGLLYTYRVVDVVPPEDGEFGGVFDPDIDDRELRDVAIASLTPNLLLDHRDDPIEPRHGWSLGAQLERAFPLFAADEEFLKLFSQGTAYLPLQEWGVLGASVRFGAIEPRAGLGRDPLVPPDFQSSGVPISERFFAGGRSSHRAYARDALGRPGDTLLAESESGELIPVGGNGLLLVNVDWRFPIFGPVEGIVFADAGNVWNDWEEIEPEELKTGAGVGVRYLSPIGPLRLEIGWKLDRLPQEDAYEVFLSFGNPF